MVIRGLKDNNLIDYVYIYFCRQQLCDSRVFTKQGSQCNLYGFREGSPHCRYTMVVLWRIVVPHIAHASFCDTVDCCRQRIRARMRHNDRYVFNHVEKRRKPVFLKHDHLFKNKEDVVTVDKTDEVEDQKVSP